jgi:PAS domain S-box-containing protein
MGILRLNTLVDYRELFEFVPVAMMVYDVETLQLLYVNGAARHLYNYSSDELLSMCLPDLRPAEDDFFLTEGTKLLMGNSYQQHSGIYRHRSKNGEIFNVRLDSKLLYIANRKCAMVFIFDLRTAAHVCQNHCRVLPGLFNAPAMGGMGYWEYIIPDGSVRWTKEACDILDVADGVDLTFERVLQCFADDSTMLLLHAPGTEFPDDSLKEYEGRLLTDKGSEKWVVQRIRLIRHNGEPYKLEGTIVDITATKIEQIATAKKAALTAYINTFITDLLRTDDWMSAFSQSLERLGQALEVDRIFYFELCTDAGKGQYVNLKLKWDSGAAGEANDAPLLVNIPVHEIKTVMDRLKEGKPYIVRLPEVEAGRLKDSMTARNIQSLIVYPIMVKGSLYGHIAFQDCRFERIWTEDEKELFDAVASNIAVAADRQQAREELIDKRQQLQSLWDNIPGITYRYGVKGAADSHIIFLSAEFEHVTGFASKTFVENKMRFHSLIHPDDDIVYLQMNERVSRHEPFQLEFRIICADGSVKWLRDSGRGIYSNSGELLWIDGVMIDITGNKLREQQLRESNERFNIVTKATYEAIIDWDIENDITVWGDGFHELFGFDLANADKLLWAHNIYHEDQSRVLNHLRIALADPGVFHFFDEFRFQSASKEIKYVQHRGIFLRDSSGKAVRAVGAMIDVTDSRMKQQRIEEQNKILMEIAWVQSHLLRAPLANILGLCEILITEGETAEDRDKMLENIYCSATHLDKLIRDVVSRTK